MNSVKRLDKALLAARKVEGVALRDRRKRLGYTQADTAMRLGISIPTIGKYERGEYVKNRALRAAIALWVGAK